MTPYKKISLPSPLAICLTSARVISLVCAVASGIWMNNAMEAGAISLAQNIAIAHAVSGAIFILLAITHAWLNRHRYAAMIAEPNSWRLHADQRVWPVNVVLFLAVTISAVVIACGNLQAIAFHSGCGLLLGVICIFHYTLGKR